MKVPTNSPTTARELRAATSEAQFNSMLLTIFYKLGELNFSTGWDDNTSQQLLVELSHLYPIEHAMLATEQAGTLTIANTVGQTLPVGSRMPMIGQMATILKAPVTFNASSSNDLRWCTASNSSELQAWLLPLSYAKKSCGLLALAGKTLNLAETELSPLHAICGLWGHAFYKALSPAAQTVNHEILDLLTPREREIFALLPSGASNLALAEKLNIAPGTVKIHVERILAKLNVKDRTQAAVKASQLGYTS
jgi:DNA-binding CsgD family transcriptional regulator